jgi:hypothetical protein
MAKPPDSFGLLVFGFDDERGEPVPLHSSADWSELLLDRLTSGTMKLLGREPAVRIPGETVPGYQVQVLWSSEHPPTSDDKAKARELFELARAKLRRAVAGSAARSTHSPGGSAGLFLIAPFPPCTGG